MVLLLDTCAFLWIITNSRKLSPKARSAFENPSNTIYLSVISTWELLLKQSLGKLPLRRTPYDYLRQQRELHGIIELPLSEAAVLSEIKLPRHHNDPLDRLLMCQAIELGCPIITSDEEISKYPVRTIW